MVFELTPSVAQLIVATIRAGSYPHVAAELAGVPRLLFYRWLAHGRKHRRSRFRPFWLEVLQAQAQARAKGEIDARQKDVKFWLRYGPGKERRPGWMPAGKERSKRRSATDTTVADVVQLLGRLSAGLTAHPEARQALLQLLEETRSPKTND